VSGILFVVSAPSGAGKTSLVQALLAAEPGVSLSISYTTRPPRPGEVDGRDYHFVSPEAFEHMLEAGEFLESATVHGNRYGTSHRWIKGELSQGHDVLLEIDWQGAQQVRKLMRGVVSIFILPPSIEALQARLVGRGQDSPQVIAQRLDAAHEEMSHGAEFEYAIINDDFDRAARDLTSIIRAERLKFPRQAARHGNMFNRIK